MKIRISLLAAALALLDGCAGRAAITLSASLPAPALRESPSSTIAYGKGIYVKVDERGRLLTSKEGTHWLIHDVGFKTFLRKVIYANGLFVAVGGSYIDQPSVVLTSENSTRWTKRKIPVKANLYGVAYGNGLFVGVGDRDTLLTSTNSVVWRRQQSNTSEVLFSSVLYEDGRFVVSGDSGTALISSNGLDWQKGAGAKGALASDLRQP